MVVERFLVHPEQTGDLCLVDLPLRRFLLQRFVFRFPYKPVSLRSLVVDEAFEDLVVIRFVVIFAGSPQIYEFELLLGLRLRSRNAACADYQCDACQHGEIT